MFSNHWRRDNRAKRVGSSLTLLVMVVWTRFCHFVQSLSTRRTERPRHVRLPSSIPPPCPDQCRTRSSW